jgi:hypothetical protein
MAVGSVSSVTRGAMNFNRYAETAAAWRSPVTPDQNQRGWTVGTNNEK